MFAHNHKEDHMTDRETMARAWADYESRCFAQMTSRHRMMVALEVCADYEIAPSDFVEEAHRRTEANG